MFGNLTIDKKILMGFFSLITLLIVTAGRDTATTIIAISLAIISSFVIAHLVSKPLSRRIRNLTESSKQLANTSGRISSGSQTLARATNEQTAELKNISSTLRSTAAAAKLNLETAKRIGVLASDSHAAADKVADVISMLDNSISRIKKSSDKIAGNIRIIDTIAFRTKLLALNAVIEAARAGSAGEVFAIIAKAIRNLNEQLAAAVKDAADITEEQLSSANNGLGLANELSESLKKVIGKLDKTSDLAGIAEADLGKQAQRIGRINTAAGQIDKVAGQNASDTLDNASVSVQLSKQVQRMNQMVAELTNLVAPAPAAPSREQLQKEHF